MSAVPEPTLEDTILSALGPKYSNVRFFKQGGTRKVYLVDWNPVEGITEQRVVKVDDTPHSPRAVRHVARNYNTHHDAKTLLSIKNPEQHHLTRVYDVEKLPFGTLSVESYFQSETLEERVERAGPLTPEQFKKVFSQVTEGMQHYMNEYDLLHRDIKPSNILVDENYNVRITDFSNAQKRSELAAKALPTAGGKKVTDPRIYAEFTGQDTAYNDRAELFALGTTMLYALTGKYHFDYDPDEKTALDAQGKSLLTDGKLDARKHSSALGKALGYSDDGNEWLLSNALSLDERRNFKSINDFAKAFKKVNDPNFLERVVRSWRKPAYAALSTFLMAATVFTAGITYHNQKQEQDIRNRIVAAKTIEDAKYQLNTKWNGSTGEITNNAVKMEVTAMIPSHYNHLRPGDGKPREPHYPTVKYLRGKPGEEISITVVAEDMPRTAKQESLSLAGSAYIEGFAGERFGVYSTSGDSSDMWGCGPCGSYAGYANLKIPSGPKDATYIMAVELYAPNTQIFDTVHMPAGKVINRIRIPIVVGDENKALDVNTIGLGFMKDHVYISGIDPLDRDIDTNLEGTTYAATLMEEGTTVQRVTPDVIYNADFALDLPQRALGTQRTMRLTAQRDGRTVWQTFYPIQYKEWTEKSNEWEIVTPDSDFAQKTIQYSAFSDKPSR